MIRHQIKHSLPLIATGLIGLFFILILPLKASYTAIPLLISLWGVILLIPRIKHKDWWIENDIKQIVVSYILFFLLFIASLVVHGGKLRELDLPSKVVLLLPVLYFLHKVRLNQRWILYAILVSSIIIGVIANYRFFLLGLSKGELFPQQMSIQAGDISMSISMFCLAIMLYFKQCKSILYSFCGLISTLSALLASIVLQSRGAWIALPIVAFLICFFYRKQLSKTLILTLVVIGLGIGFSNGKMIQARWDSAKSEIVGYWNANNGTTSIGARFDMWKSSLIAIEEKPIFGRGIEAISELRRIHYEQGIISKVASKFTNPHNQYFYDTTARGLLGLIALLALFFVPLRLFWKNMRQVKTNSLTYLWGILGISHIVCVMIYCLTQSFLAHNSGIMFFAFGTLLFYGLQKNSQNPALVED